MGDVPGAWLASAPLWPSLWTYCDPQKSPDTPGSPEGNTEGPATPSSEPLLPSGSRQESRFPCMVCPFVTMYQN